jgi:hypothetical protein
MRKILLSLAVITLLGLSCTKDFKDINTNNLGIPYGGSSGGSSSAVQDASGFLPTIMAYIYPSNGAAGVASWVYQIQQNFNSDIYSGYWMMAGGFGHGNTVESNYYLYQGWDDWLYSSWSNIVNPFLTLQSSAWVYPNATNQAALGMAFTSKVMISVRIADAEGTLPYTNNNVYDSLGKIYNTFFSELDSASFYLSKNSSSNIGANDYFYGGNIAKWITLTNSLRLELAMRIVKVNPDLAQTQAEKAMATGNLITDNSQNAAYVPAGQVEGALSTLNYTWGVGNTTPGADVASYLVGYNDPRLPIFLSPTNSSNTPSRVPVGGYCTQRLGSVQVPGDVNLAASMFSLPGTGIPQSNQWCADHPASSTFFNAAETDFLLAEASLRGWNMGSYTSGAQAYYTAGVTASMNQWGVTLGNYLATTATPADFTDPTLPERDIKAVSTCSPKWDDASSNESHLEQIMTQKWIALWPVNSSVAWSEYRRTGYPKLFPAYFSAVAPTISWGGLTVDNARKIKLPNNEYLNNTANVYNAINQYLGGTDAITTHVWWDVDKPNF